MSFSMKAGTAFNLGMGNLLKVFKYRMGIKTGLNAVQQLSTATPSGHFFSEPNLVEKRPVSFPSELTAFSHLKYSISNYPDWFYNPLTKQTLTESQQPWYTIPDFDARIGDIKGIWEASRFDWLIDFSLQKKYQQNEQALALMDAWLNDWCQHNAAYVGPHWKCGQETSIRVMHLITVLIGLKQFEKLNQNVLDLIEIHLKRVAPTIEYAIAQDNNHGTSEATALFIGGELLNHFNQKPTYQKWAKIGRKWLENRASKLIMSDGGFSQYSVTYHRVMLDSYCLAEIVRKKLQLAPFSQNLYQKLALATNWLYVLTQDNGDAPNLGANDGAHLIPVCGTDYRDFTPTVQLASTLFCSFSYYQSKGKYDRALDFFQEQKTAQFAHTLPSKNQFFNESGLITAQYHAFFIAFKLPIYRFRPSQCDALHLDVWWQGKNILRDGGTYSYNTTADDLNYFSGVASHNTVQFDGHLQMPRLSRFLFGAWLKPLHLSYQKEHFTCAYNDYWKCSHKREIQLSNSMLTVTDHITGFQNHAILRWRLAPDSWLLQDNTLTNGTIKIQIQSEAPLQIALVDGIESRYYYQKSVIPVLEITVSQPTHITTIIQDLK